MIKLKIKYGNSQTDLHFPCTEKALQEALAEIGAEQVRPLELYVTEVVFPEDLDFLQDRFANLDEVNYLAKRMDSFFGDEEYQFYEAMKLEGFDTLPDLINLSFNLNRYPLIRDIGDMGKIGREYLLTVKGCVPAHDEDDPKYAQLGRELIQSGITAIIRNRENTLKGLFGNLILTELNHFFYTFSLTSIVTLQKRRAIF